MQLGSPPEALWKGYHGTVPEICRILRLPTGRAGVGHRSVVYRTLRAIVLEEGDRGRGGGYEGQGQQEKLTINEALVAAHALRTGCGQQQAMHTVNAWRAKKSKGPVSVSAMRSSICKLGVKRYGGKREEICADRPILVSGCVPGARVRAESVLKVRVT